jgi:hypothetical protein
MKAGGDETKSVVKKPERAPMRNHNGQLKPNRSPSPIQLEHIEAIEKSLWNAADTLRSNSNYASNEYFMPVMGLIDHWREKETTRDGVRITIHDFLYSEATGLPISSYSEAEVGVKTENVFRHVYWAYPTVPSPYYSTHA